MTGTRVGWKVRAGLGLVAAAVAGFQLRHFLSFSPEGLTEHGYLADDAFFYSVLARNYHDLGFFTLDGEMPTNGFQPLWMLVQVLLQGVFGGSDGVTLLAVSSWASFVGFAFLTTVYAARGTLPRALLGAAVVTVLVTANVGFHFLAVTGLEVPLTLALLCATLLTVDHLAEADIGPGHGALLGLLSGLCFLARTDLFWVAVVLLAWLARVRRVPTRGILTFVGATALLVVPYLAWNVAAHGALVPISGRVKAWYLAEAFPDQASYWASDEWRSLPVAVESLVKAHVGGGGAAFPWFAGALFLLAMVVTWRRRERLPMSHLLLTAGVAIHVLVLYGWYRELRPYSAYYFAGDVLWLVFALAFAAARLGRRLPAGLAAGAFVACILIGLRASSFAERTRAPSPYWAARLELARVLPERVGAFWPGLFAQFSGAAVTPLDGVIGSADYFEKYVQTSTELAYLAEHGVRDVVIYLPGPVDELFAHQPPPVDGWNQRGRRRLWQVRHRLTVVGSVPFGDAGEGWHLVRIGQ